MPGKTNILVIDGQGGGLGRQLIEELRKALPDAQITAVGTNSTATASMLKSSPDHAATGENAVIVACRTAEYIVGPIGIAITDSLWGEVTPAMAAAVGSSNAKRILIPFNHCNNVIVGVADLNLGRLIQAAVEQIPS
jgi:hypothetical protein